MAMHRKEHFERQTLILDGNDFVECEMKKCNLVYKGRESVRFEHSHISGCTWQFEDAALRTVIMLKGLYTSGPHGREVVDAIFRNAPSAEPKGKNE